MKLDVLMLAGASAAVQRAAAARAEKLVAQGETVWLLAQKDGQLTVKDAGKSLPQSLRFDLAPDDPDGLSAFLRQIKIGRIEITDASGIAPPLLKWVQACRKPVDLYLTDAAWVLSPNKNTSEPCLAVARSILAADKTAEIFAKKHFASHVVACVANEKSPATRKVSRSDKSKACGIIGLRVNAAETGFMKDLSLSLRKWVPKSELILFGETLDDLDLMTAETMFVSGSIPDENFADLCDLYGVKKLFAASRMPFFGDPLLTAARASGLPLAYFDWTDGRSKKSKNDLPLDHLAPVAAVALALADWMDWS